MDTVARMPVIVMRLVASSALVVAFGSCGYFEASNRTAPEEVTVVDLQAAQAARSAFIIPMRSGDEPPIFSDQVSTLNVADEATEPNFDDGEVEVTLTRGEDPQQPVCISAHFLPPGGSSEGCLGLDEIRTGLSFQISQAHGGPIQVVGIVPDDVAEVLIDDHPVLLSNNVWHYAGDPGSKVNLAVRSADGTQVATLAW
ncbi:MAG: hypothetical protein R2761_28725 [Acidimicrobiales bacterium]